MGNKLKEFCEYVESPDFKNRSDRFSRIISKYSFIYISESENIENENLKDLFQSVGESSYLIIGYGKSDPDVKDGYFVINISKKILFIDESSLNKLFSAKSGFSIYFIKDAKSFFDKRITIEYNEMVFDDFSLEQILNLKRSLPHLSKLKFKEIWSNVLTCISGFLIMKSYKKLEKDRMNDFFSKPIINTDHLKIKEDDYIEVGRIGSGYNSMVDLIYHIEREELCALKRFNMNDNESLKLFEREKSNYLKLNHPFIPKFYDTTDHNGIIIEYIRGHGLYHIHKLQLSEDDKLTIIFELLLVFEYLHQKGFVYRDLKPSDVIIDENKDIVLIDFDRMINNDPDSDPDHEHTVDFGSSFCAPEIIRTICLVSYKCDIYSLGSIIYYIIFEKEPEYHKEINDLNVNLPIHKIIKQCIESNPAKRPNCSDLITYFLINFHSRVLRKEFTQYFTHFLLFIRIQFFLQSLLSIDSIYLKDEYLKQKITKSEYYNVFAGKNSISQYILGKNGNENKVIIENYYSIIPKYDCAGTGLICDYKANDELVILSDSNIEQLVQFYSYFEGLITQNGIGYIYYDLMDIQKSLHNLTLSAEKNNPIAQLKLGTIYYENEIIRDIKKAIRYLSLSANQMNSEAMNILGYIYYTELEFYDINKSIHYFTLSSNMNNAFSQYNLGLIYQQGKYIERDINRSILYFSLASNQGHVDACYKLGFIYYENKYISRDISKSIHYLTLAAHKNHVDAQFQLATIYLSGKYVERDTDKGIFYLQLAAEQNYSNAQFALGIIYYSGIFVQRDIISAIHYLSRASSNNHSNAQFQLGTIYYNEKYIPRNINKAIHYFALASKQNHRDAQFSLGLIYYSGEFVTQDIYRAIYYFHLAAHQNHPDAQFSLGMIYSCGEYFKPDYKRAIDFFNQAADLNNPNAQYQLGIIYYNGEHVDQDTKAALHYLESASRQKFIEASFALGIIYYTGEHVTRSIKKSIDYLSIAASMNHSNAQFALGMIYYEGYYIARNINKAIHYFSLSSNNNNSNAQFILGLIYYEGIYVSRDIDKSIHYYKLSSNNYNSDAQLNLGMIYYEGIFTPQNIRESIKYLQLSANQHNSIAQYQLGVFYLFGKHIEQNIHKAIAYLELSANANNSNAQFVLGYVYYSEEFAELNIGNSIKYLKMATEQKHSNAFFALGYIYQCNNQVKNSIENYVSSSNLNNVYAKNNLGVYYFKNKNIKAAIKLFKEAIEIDNDVYSSFNLARIYYYGIGVVPKISKAISLMQKAFDKKFYLAGYFLFVVYLRGDGAVKNVLKAAYLKNKILGKFPNSQSWFDDINFDEFHQFVKRYCLLQYTFKSTKNIKRSSFFQPKKINDLFYDGLGNDIYQKNG